VISGVRKVEVVLNLASGSVSADAPREAGEILAQYWLSSRVQAAAPEGLRQGLKAAIAASPDLLVVVAGDGTARSAAELCGQDGPLFAPLAGGTMNMLPHAIYGARPWQEALVDILDSGVERPLAGGTVDGKLFLVAAILGAPALWAPAREAMRQGKARLALERARAAWSRAFSSRLRYVIGSGVRQKGEAVIFMCPTASRRLSDDEQALEAAGLDLSSALEAVRLGLNAAVGDWRNDPAVVLGLCRQARVWAARDIPALLDGETVQLGPMARVAFVPQVARVLAPSDEPPRGAWGDVAGTVLDPAAP
jgi:diacylglycerol kinase family enzyme